ncbi:hypothetical protein C8N43_1623 [Litoreibacter ponti]|uniref:Uncharacterized protein n=1 Tax=Litoreibacter ponti TaxID=1510457 RepID=A0A2T6BLK7_9RHOB|nr:hypothetical protein [Litoreibacter ponti]PTX56958.1 hypothetical protein C8N43_1623 [Litoreibacter ponti]
MKHFFATTALIAALSAPAFADGHGQVQAALEQMGFEADASKLSASERGQLELLLNGSDMSPAARQGQIEQILTDAGAMSAPTAGDTSMLQAQLDQMGIAADASTLTGAQVAQLELILNGSNASPAAKQGRVELIFEGDNAISLSSNNGRMAVDMSMNSLRNQVSNTLEGSGVDCDVYALSDEQVTQLYVAVTSSMSSGDAIQAARSACM